MSTVSYHCPNCGSGLRFNPVTGDFTCEYCESSFNRYDLDNQADYTTAAAPEVVQDENNGQQVAEYFCSNCGAHIITALTTVATECYYCNNPVIMQQSICNNIPARIVPFKVNKEEAKKQLRQWLFKKSYIPVEFKDDQYIDRMQGIYFPYWMADVDGEVCYEGIRKKNEIKSINNADIKTVARYKVFKEGHIHMEDVMLSALKTPRSKLIEGVQPFDEADMEPFTMTYLSGFQAEQKDVGVEEVNTPETMAQLEKYAEQKVRETCDYLRATHETKKFSLVPTNINWEYSLMPVWVVTYRYKGELYHFAINGQTGKSCGRVPIDKKRLDRNMFLLGLFTFCLIYVLFYIAGGGFGW